MNDLLKENGHAPLPAVRQDDPGSFFASLVKKLKWYHVIMIMAGALILLGMRVGTFEAQVKSDRERVERVDSDSKERVDNIRAAEDKAHEALHREVIDRLNDIKISQRTIENKIDDAHGNIDHIKDQIRDITLDLNKVCDKVSGHCRTTK